MNLITYLNLVATSARDSPETGYSYCVIVPGKLGDIISICQGVTMCYTFIIHITYNCSGLNTIICDFSCYQKLSVII